MKLAHPKFAFQLVTLFVAVLLAAQSSMATTAILATDDDLINSSRVILIGDVKSVKSQAHDESIYTYIKLDSLRILKGRLRGNQIVVRQPGGTVGDNSVIVFGAPQFKEGQRVLLFLDVAPDGTLRIAHLFMGKYDIVEDPQTKRVRAERPLDKQDVLLLGRREGAGITNTSDLSQFVGKIGSHLNKRGLGSAVYPQRDKGSRIVEVPPEYVDEPAGNADKSAENSGMITPKYYPSNGPVAYNLYRSEPDRFASVNYRVNKSYGVPCGLDGVAEVMQGMKAWSDVGSSKINLQYIGSTSARRFSDDNQSVIVFNDPDNVVQDRTSQGVIIAATQINRVDNNTRKTIDGIVFHRIVDADIVFNNGVEDVLCDSANMAEVATHELGHTIGFDHTGTPDAAMRAFLYFNRGAYLGLDDVTGATFIYPEPFNPIDEQRFFVGYHYRDFLLREPDRGGWDFWTNQITAQCGTDADCIDRKRVDVSRAYWFSSEFQNRQDVRDSNLVVAPGADHPFDNGQFVRWCYLNYLRREPGAGPDNGSMGGYYFWLGELERDLANDPGQGGYNHLIRAFLVSGEFRDTRAVGRLRYRRFE